MDLHSGGMILNEDIIGGGSSGQSDSTNLQDPKLSALIDSWNLKARRDLVFSNERKSQLREYPHSPAPLASQGPTITTDEALKMLIKSKNRKNVHSKS